jgi:hypothetical protein
VGTYNITGQGFSRTGSNFSNAPVYAGALTIGKKPFTASTTSVSKVYDGTTAMSSLSISLSPVLAGDQVTATGLGTFVQSNVGSNINYNVANLLLNGVDSGNYLLTNGSTFSGSNGVITPATLTYTATPTTSTFGNTPSVNAGTVSGFVNGENQLTATSGTLLFSTTATAASNEGSYAITGSGLTANNGNYSFVHSAGNASALTIIPVIVAPIPKTSSGAIVFVCVAGMHEVDNEIRAQVSLCVGAK